MDNYVIKSRRSKLMFEAFLFSGASICGLAATINPPMPRRLAFLNMIGPFGISVMCCLITLLFAYGAWTSMRRLFGSRIAGIVDDQGVLASKRGKLFRIEWGQIRFLKMADRATDENRRTMVIGYNEKKSSRMRFWVVVPSALDISFDDFDKWQNLIARGAKLTK